MGEDPRKDIFGKENGPRSTSSWFLRANSSSHLHEHTCTNAFARAKLSLHCDSPITNESTYRNLPHIHGKELTQWHRFYKGNELYSGIIFSMIFFGVSFQPLLVFYRT